MPTDLAALQAKRQTLTALDAQIAAQDAELDQKLGALRAEHEKGMAELHRERAKLASEIGSALRAELSALGVQAVGRQRTGRTSRGSIDREAIVNVLQAAQLEISAADIKERAGITASSNSLSIVLKRMVDQGQIVRIGERRGSKYRIR